MTAGPRPGVPEAARTTADDGSPDAARALELAVHLNNLLRAYAEAGPDGDDPLRLLLHLLEDLCRALRELAAEAAHLDRPGARHWLGRSRVGDKLLFLIEAVFLLLAEQPEEVAARSRGFVEASLGENLLGTVREVLRRHADYGAFVAEAVRGAEAAVGLDFFVAELRGLPDPRAELRAEVERLGAELAAVEAALRERSRARDPGATAREALRRVRAAVARKYHPDAVRGDSLARLVRQEVFKELQHILEEVEAGLDGERPA